MGKRVLIAPMQCLGMEMPLVKSPGKRLGKRLSSVCPILELHDLGKCKDTTGENDLSPDQFSPLIYVQITCQDRALYALARSYSVA